MLTLALHLAVPAYATEVAVTVDDLPITSDTVPGLSRIMIAKRVLKALKKHRVPEAYGFINASNLIDAPEFTDILDHWTRAGYPLGNHTYTHMELSKNPVSSYEREIDLNDRYLAEYTRKNPSKFDYKFFRFPFLDEGDTLAKRNSIRRHLHETGYQTAEVTLDFLDWMWSDVYPKCFKKNDPKSISRLKKAYVRAALKSLKESETLAHHLFHREIKHVLLLHIGAFDSIVLDEMLQAFEDAGVKFIDLKTALSDPIYRINPNRPNPGGSSFLEQIAESRHQEDFMPEPDEKLKDRLEAICR